MTIIKIVKEYDINPNGKFCGHCNCCKKYYGWINTYQCKVFDISLDCDSTCIGWPGGYEHKPLRCKKCLKKLKVDKGNK